MSASNIKNYIIGTALLLIAGTWQAKAQISPMQAAFFQNQYMANPAMAGLNKGLDLNLGYQHQWTSISGSPMLQNLSLDYNAGNKVGLGFIITNDNAGLISQTRAVGTYAYHLPISETEKFNLGVSFGFNNSYIDYSKIVGDQGDQSVALLNERKVYLDGDVGVAYTNNNLNIQAALPNLGSVIFNNNNSANLSVDHAIFYTAISYKYQFGETTRAIVEPKIAYRGIKGFENIGDVGANLKMEDYNFDITGLYHTNKSFTMGAGVNLNPIAVVFYYNGNLGPLVNQANNTFEFGVKYSLIKRQ